jgi:sialic acid synthase
MAERTLNIGPVTIDDSSECFVIAEIGHNHQANVETCKEMFQAAKYAGATSVKLQKRSNKDLYTQAYYDSIYNSENAYGPTYGTHREALEFGKDEYQELKKYAEELGLIFFATAFDVQSADFLEELDVPCYKIASGDLTNIPLLKYVAGLGKPMIVSTGAATLEDVRRAHDAIMEINPQLALLQCTATYPSDFTQLDLNVITTYRNEFPDIVVGLSGHDNGIAMAPVAYVLGARIIEKHFTLNRAMKGTDHAFSLEPLGMQKMVRDLKRVRVALGDGAKKLYPEEISARTKMGKKIVAARSLPQGHVLQPGDLAFKSPGDGLPPYEAEKLYGKALKVALDADDNLSFDLVEGKTAPVA